MSASLSFASAILTARRSVGAAGLSLGDARQRVVNPTGPNGQPEPFGECHIRHGRSSGISRSAGQRPDLIPRLQRARVGVRVLLHGPEIGEQQRPPRRRRMLEQERPERRLSLGPAAAMKREQRLREHEVLPRA